MLSLRVAARYQAADSRSNAKHLTTPINPPKGISKDIVKDNATLMGREDESDPARKDIRPKDVFNLSPNSGGVLNLAQTGKDLDKTLRTQIPKDKGYDTVSNLSQYLIRTEGGGGTPAVGKK